MKKRYLFVFVFLLFAFVSCRFGSEGISDSSGDFIVVSGTLHVPNEAIVLTRSITTINHSELDSASTNEISHQVRNLITSRQAFPTAASGTLYYTLTCKGTSVTTNGTVDSSTLTFSIKVPTGSSTITVKAFIDEAKSKQVYEGSLSLTDVTTSTDLTNQIITLKDMQSGEEATATVSLPILINSDASISSIYVEFSDSSGVSSSITKDDVTAGSTYYFNLKMGFSDTQATTANTVPGDYDVIFSFYATDSSSKTHLAYKTTQKITASNYLTTSTWTKNNVDSCINSSGVMEITNALCTSFLSTIFYVDSTNGNDSASGSFSNPFKSIQKAVTTISSINDGTSTYTIFLKSNIEATSADEFTNGSLVEIADNANIFLKMESYPQKATFTINADDKGRILYVGSGNSVTIKSLVLTKGSSSDGAGIYNKGTLTFLENITLNENMATRNGAALYNEGTATARGTFSSNSADYFGGGIYNSGTLTLDGCTFKKNTANTSGGAVYSSKSFKVSGSTVAEEDSNSNDFYLDNSSDSPYITLSSDFSCTSGTTSARITLASYSEDYQILSGDGVSEINCGYFSLSNEDYEIDADGKLDKVETVYSSWSVLSSVIEKDTESGGFGTVSYKIANISDFDNTSISLSGDISQNDTVNIIPSENLSISVNGNSITSISNPYFNIQNLYSNIGSDDYSITFGDSEHTALKEFIYLSSDVNSTFTNCIFQNTNAFAIKTEGALLLKDCSFKNISASGFGSVYVANGTTIFDSCTFTNCKDYDIYTYSGGTITLRGTLSDISIYVENIEKEHVITLDTSLALTPKATAAVKIFEYNSSTEYFASSDGGEISETIRNYFTVTDEDGNSYTINADGTLREKVFVTSLSSIKDYSDLKSGGTYSISNEEELNLLATLCNSGDAFFPFEEMTILLEKDLELTCDSSKPFTPIGTSVYTFAGTFDGQNHKISNLYINSSDQVGLFANLNGGKIKNLTVEGTVFSTTGSNATKYGTGGIVGYALSSAVIENCVSKVNVIGNDRAHIGGICGYATMDTIIRNCINIGTVTSSVEYTGGVVGLMEIASFKTPTIYNCANFGNVTGTSNVGGIVGSSAGDVSVCYNVGTVSGSDSSVAAIANVTGSTPNYYSSCFYLDGSASSGFVGTSIEAISFSDVSTLKSDLTTAVSSSSYSENCNSWSNYTYTLNSVDYPVCVDCGSL